MLDYDLLQIYLTYFILFFFLFSPKKVMLSYNWVYFITLILMIV